MGQKKKIAVKGFRGSILKMWLEGVRRAKFHLKRQLPIRRSKNGRDLVMPLHFRAKVGREIDVEQEGRNVRVRDSLLGTGDA